MSATITRHRPTVRSWVADTDQGAAWCHQARCACGEVFAVHHTKPDAEADRAAHISAVAPPPDRQCRDLRTHRNRPWDLCPLCAWQDPLPGF